MERKNQLYHESATGWLEHIPNSTSNILIIGEYSRESATLKQEPALYFVHFAFAFLYETDFFLPYRVVDDFRREFQGKDALDFIRDRGASFPRADVLGIRVSTGSWAEIFLKEIDPHQGLIPFATTKSEVLRDLIMITGMVEIDPARFTAELQPLKYSDTRWKMLTSCVPCFQVGGFSQSLLAGIVSVR